MQQVRRFLELIRFSHTLFALPFALFSSVLAWHTACSPAPSALFIAVPAGPPRGDCRWLEGAGTLLCLACPRRAARAFTRLVDRDVDALNPRPASRPLPAGLLSVRTVVFFLLL